MAYHWARMIEVLHSIEKIQELLNDPDLQGTDLVTKGERLDEVVGCSRRRAARCSTTTRSTSRTR
jgi:coenzyme F420-reducing hydrogenase alpha subunit